MFKELPEGTTHYNGDNCGEPAHNDIGGCCEKCKNSETVLKGERRRIIEQIREEEREKVAREIGRKIMFWHGRQEGLQRHDLSKALQVVHEYYSHKEGKE